MTKAFNDDYPTKKLISPRETVWLKSKPRPAQVASRGFFVFTLVGRRGRTQS